MMKILTSITIFFLIFMNIAYGNYNYTCIDNSTLQIIESFNITEDGDNIIFEIVKLKDCEYNCSETIFGTQCRSSPFFENATIIGIFFIVLILIVLLKMIFTRLFQ